MIYLVIGAMIGLVVGGMTIYLLPYRMLRRDLARAQTDLTDDQTKYGELQDALQDERTAIYQVRQQQQQQQQRFEGELEQERERYATLERQCADLQADRDQQQETHLREATKLRDTIERLEREQAALQDRFARDSEQWERERHSLLLHNSQFEEQLRVLRQDKAALDERLEQQQESWERERLALQIQMNTLEDNLSLQKARASHPGYGLSPDSQHLAEQLKAAAARELNQQRLAWEEERQAMREQLERLQAERRVLREQAATAGIENPSSGFANLADQEVCELRRQVEQAQRECQQLEEKLAARERQGEQEKIALEAEIEQLMERLLRLHRERSA
ncbi:MAG: hypothetical protein IPM89_02475 [Candidatus Competibacteraceae bacterium]|nr:MAG: hypothetical protein IPM89_02475 [Candidatus Competibacteraceae bacterium]